MAARREEGKNNLGRAGAEENINMVAWSRITDKINKATHALCSRWPLPMPLPWSLHCGKIQMGGGGAGDGPGTGPPSWPLQIYQINTKRSGAGTARDGDSLAGLDRSTMNDPPVGLGGWRMGSEGIETEKAEEGGRRRRSNKKEETHQLAERQPALAVSHNGAVGLTLISRAAP